MGTKTGSMTKKVGKDKAKGAAKRGIPSVTKARTPRIGGASAPASQQAD